MSNMLRKNVNHEALVPGANGRMLVRLGWRGLWHGLLFWGGPFDKVPYDLFNYDDVFGVCVRAEREPDIYNVRVPIRDFSVPQPEQREEMVSALKQTIEAAMQGKLVYVGCAGGWGRTGLFLALLAKALDVKDPVRFVRSTYTSHAVETKPQENYVKNFDVASIRRWLFWAALRNRWS